MGGFGVRANLGLRGAAILSIRRVYPCLEVGNKVSLFLRNLELVVERFRKRFLNVTGSNKVEKFRPQWLTRDQLVKGVRLT